METYRLEFVANNGCRSACKITIYRKIQLVIATEIDEGVSITNACARIATEVVNRYNINPERMIFIEHYPSAQRAFLGGDTYDLVTFTFDWTENQFRKPVWKHIPLADFQSILQSIG